MSSEATGAGTIRVPLDATTIQGAIDAADPYEVIIVQPGEYLITASIRFRGKALALRSAGGPEATTIRMTSNGSVVVFDGGEGPDTVIEGFTLTGGVGTGSSLGGGVYCTNSSPTLKSMIITENRATYGGALYCSKSSPTLIDCSLSRNNVTCGGGAYCEASSPVFRNCTIRGNKGSYASSGIHSKSGSAPCLENCRILGNATYYGGGVDSFQSFPTLRNCIIAGNRAGQGGAAYISAGSSMHLVNCTIVGNVADQAGGGVYCQSLEAVMVNCILWENEPSSTNGTMTNCLLGSDPFFVKPVRFDTMAFYSVNIQGVTCQLPSFIVDEPDFRLRYGSPAVDAGTSAGAPSTDIDGVERPQGRTVDIGAYEYAGAPGAEFRRGDTNGDGEHDIGDVVFFLLSLFAKEAEPLSCRRSGDSNDDGRLNISDAIYLLRGLFLGQSLPAAPFPSCGPDPTPDTLGCDSYEPCVPTP